MKHIVAYSGGLSSFEAAARVVAQYGTTDTICVFTDTKTEDEDLYRFLNETEKWLGCEFVRIADGRNIWQVFTDVRFMGNSRVDPCSKHLKRDIFRKYLDAYRPDECVLYYGIGANEAHRSIALIERWAPYTVAFPLIETAVSKEQILLHLDQIGILPPRLYDLGFEHNNCGGFCVKTGQRQMLRLLRTMPERYAWHEQQQEELFAKIGPHGFIRRTVNGELSYLSLRQFRELVEAGEIVQMFEDGACACFT